MTAKQISNIADNQTGGVPAVNVATRIDTADPRSKWRYSCPEGHTNWRPCENVVECRTCGEYYEILIDDKSEAEIKVDEVDFRRSDLPTEGEPR